MLTRVGQSGLCVCVEERGVCGGGGEGSGQSDRPSTLKKNKKVTRCSKPSS